MKKMFFLASMLLSSLAINAQSEAVVSNDESKGQKQENEFKVDPGKFMMEVGFSPIAGTVNEVNLIGGQLRGIYVVSEKVEVKLGVGFGLNKTKSDNGESGAAWAENANRVSSFSINPGVNYIFEGTKKLSPYIGAELGYGMSASKVKRETNAGKIIDKNADVDRYNNFKFNALAGFDYFFAKNIFVGVEVGLGVNISVLKESYTETTADGKTTKDESKVDAHTVNFAPSFTPSLRLGWAF